MRWIKRVPGRWSAVRAVLLIFALAFATCPQSNDAVNPVREHHATVAQPGTSGSWWTRFRQLNQRVKSAPATVMFIGDSITHGWEFAGQEAWMHYFAHMQPLNLGIERDGTENVLWRLEHGHLDGRPPRLAVVLIGTNNAGRDAPEEIASGVRRIVQRLHDRSTRTRILLLAIFPRGADRFDPHRIATQAANRYIARLVDNRTIFYLDIGPQFLNPDGTFRAGISRDHVHLTRLGYERWAQAMLPTLNRLLSLP